MTSTACWTAMLATLVGLTFIIGPLWMLKLYVVPYWVITQTSSEVGQIVQYGLILWCESLMIEETRWIWLAATKLRKRSTNCCNQLVDLFLSTKLWLGLMHICCDSIDFTLRVQVLMYLKSSGVRMNCYESIHSFPNACITNFVASGYCQIMCLQLQVHLMMFFCFL